MAMGSFPAMRLLITNHIYKTVDVGSASSNRELPNKGAMVPRYPECGNRATCNEMVEVEKGRPSTKIPLSLLLKPESHGVKRLPKQRKKKLRQNR